MEQKPINIKKFATIKNTVGFFPEAITEGGLRFWIFQAEKNGLKKHLRKVGGKILIDIEGFSAWLDEKKM